MARAMLWPKPPPHVAELVQIVGWEAALKLIEAHGGTNIWIPGKVAETMSLARAIGLPAAEALVQAHGRGRYAVPLARQWRLAIYKARGASNREIALRLCMTEKAVSEGIGRPSSSCGQSRRRREAEEAA